MASHVEHHFVPRFLLEQWHTPPDQKLSSFRWANGDLIMRRYKAKSVAKERHLYSMERSSPQPDVKVEREFWGPHIDDPASVVHAKMLRDGVGSLDVEEKKTWAPFLVSLMLRGPAMIRKIRERGREILGAGLDERPDEYMQRRGDAPEATLRKWVEKHSPDVFDDVGIMTLPELAFSEKLNLRLLNSTWAIRSVGAAKYDLLIGDRPLIIAGTLETSFLIALPVAPRKVFFACNEEATFENIKGHDSDALVGGCNVSSVAGAERYVYGTNDRQESFVKKYLRPPLT